MSVATITARELFDQVQRGESVELIDVRTPAEFREIHATPARSVPLETFDTQAVIKSRTSANGHPLYVICRTGSRAGQACQKLMAAGLTDVVSVEGGTLAWEQAGLPVKRGRKTISLERQVRIAAGALVLIGSILAWTVHPYFLVIPAFIGAGLVFAGITDTCGMGMMLARMPWNQVSPEHAGCKVG